MKNPRRLKSQWVTLISAAAQTWPAIHYSGVQKIINQVSWTIPGRLGRSLKIVDVGYTGAGNKLKALQRNYWNEESYRRASTKLSAIQDKNKYGSVGFSMTGIEKTGYTKQDFCMQSTVLTHYPNIEGIHVQVFYRSTELIKRFGADLVFFRDHVQPRIEEDHGPVSQWGLFFSNTTVHPMFFPIFLAHIDTPVDFLMQLRANDITLWNRVVKWMTKYVLEGEDSWVQNFSQAKQVHRAMVELWKPRSLKLMGMYLENQS